MLLPLDELLPSDEQSVLSFSTHGNLSTPKNKNWQVLSISKNINNHEDKFNYNTVAYRQFHCSQRHNETTPEGI